MDKIAFSAPLADAGGVTTLPFLTLCRGTRRGGIATEVDDGQPTSRLRPPQGGTQKAPDAFQDPASQVKQGSDKRASNNRGHRPHRSGSFHPVRRPYQADAAAKLARCRVRLERR